MKPVTINKTNVKKILKWCKSHYGSSRFNNNKKLKLFFDKHLESGEWLAAGEYCPTLNAITINLEEHKGNSILYLIDTVIHEYTHFKQDIKVMYQKYLNHYSYCYTNHPYEITARKVAKRDKRQCYKEVFGSQVD